MDYQLFHRLISSSNKNKKKILDLCGTTYAGFNKMIKNQSVRVDFLERFCSVTNSHISLFFEDWIVSDEKKVISNMKDLEGAELNKSIMKETELLLQSKNELIDELKDRIKEQSELLKSLKNNELNFVKKV